MIRIQVKVEQESARNLPQFHPLLWGLFSKALGTLKSELPEHDQTLSNFRS